MKRMIWYDGEGIAHEDFNLSQNYILKSIYDHWAGNLGGESDAPWIYDSAEGEFLRPLRNAGAPINVTGSENYFNGGMFIQADYSATLDDEGPTYLVCNHEDVEAVTFASTGSGFDRRDLVQARLVLTDDSAESRDFKDDETGALSTSAVVKQTGVYLDWNVKQGTDNLADTVANEPTPDAGYFKLFSARVTDGGEVYSSSFWDWRKPWGFVRGFTPGPLMMRDPGEWTTSGLLSRILMSGTSDNVSAICPFAQHYQGTEPTSSYLHYNHIRLRKIELLADPVSGPSNAYCSLRTFNYSTALGGTAPSQIDGIGSSADGLVGDRITSSAAAHEVYGPTYTDDLPLWACGAAHSSLSLSLMLNYYTENADYICGVRWEGWGGF